MKFEFSWLETDRANFASTRKAWSIKRNTCSKKFINNYKQTKENLENSQVAVFNQGNIVKVCLKNEKGAISIHPKESTNVK